MGSKPAVAFVAGGRLMLQRGEAAPVSVASPFAEDVRVRAARIARKHDWKMQGTSARFQRGLLWGGGFDGDDPQQTAVRVTALARGRGGQLLYAMQSGPVTGVFSLDPAAERPEATEQRLFHSAEVSIQHLGSPEPGGFLCCSAYTKAGAHVAVMREDGSELTELTEGDSVDAAPAWVPSADRQLVFQTAGIGRNAQGVPVGISASAVHRLDVPSGAVTTLHADDKHDLLGPRVTQSGALLCIRKPYATPHRSSPLRALLDLLLFPFRVIFALLQWLNFFTARYTGKPLTTAGGPERKGADARQMMIWGNLIDAREAAADAERYGDDPSSLVPRSWQLVRKRGADAELEVLAKGVVCFDLTQDERIVFSNGKAIYLLDADGKRHKLASDEDITTLVTL